MEKQPKKTDESVKAGLQIEGNTKPVTENKSAQTDLSGEEKDADEQVHQPKNETADESVEQDLDEVVHKQHSITTTTTEKNEEVDGDDVAHGG